MVMNAWKIARFHRIQRVKYRLYDYQPMSPHPRRQKRGPFRKRYEMTDGTKSYAFKRHHMYDCDWQLFILDKKLRKRS